MLRKIYTICSPARIFMMSVRPVLNVAFSVASNAIETKDNEMTCFIIFCFNCIRCDENASFKTGLVQDFPLRNVAQTYVGVNCNNRDTLKTAQI